jgi:hypothetical protein
MNVSVHRQSLDIDKRVAASFPNHQHPGHPPEGRILLNWVHLGSGNGRAWENRLEHRRYWLKRHEGCELKHALLQQHSLSLRFSAGSSSGPNRVW